MEQRVIKFRAWDNVLKYMVPDYDNWIDFQGNYWTSPDISGDTPHQEIVRKDYYTLMQFTGLKDKAGVEIYEGDLVAEIDKIEDLEKWGDPLIVKFGEFIDGPDSWGVNSCTTGFYLLYKDGSVTGIHNRESAYGFESKDIIVVGNIYQNPELLNTESGLVIRRTNRHQ